MPGLSTSDAANGGTVMPGPNRERTLRPRRGLYYCNCDRVRLSNGQRCPECGASAQRRRPARDARADQGDEEGITFPAPVTTTGPATWGERIAPVPWDLEDTDGNP